MALTLFKFISGIIGRSGAMIADSIHSLSDFATDIVVLVSFGIIKKPPDKTHDYGHGKFETLAASIIGLALFFVGLGIFYSAGKKIYTGIILKKTLESPGFIALIAAVISIVIKEWLYRYTIRTGKWIRSQAVIANAWHHRSDAFSSIGTFLGIGGAILLGENWTILDPIAAITVSFFIIKAAYDISLGSIKELLEESLDEDTEQKILRTIERIKDIKDAHDLKTRKVGNKVVIDVHIRVANDLSVTVAHGINNKIEKKLRDVFGEDTIINIHTEPEIE